MLRITERVLKNWADQIETDSLQLAEHDCRITYLLSDIFSNDFLKERLLLKGGTAINKLHLQELSRLSVDLDFNQVGPKNEVLKDAKKVREIITNIIYDHDASYKIRYDYRYEQTTLHAKYAALVGKSFQPIKLEISHVETFPILKTETKNIFLYDSNDTRLVNTYKIEELVATKLRALYGRAKIRDLYDVNAALRSLNDKNAVRKMLLFYLYRNRTIFNPKVFLAKLQSDKYSDDISVFLKSGSLFDVNAAKRNVIEGLDFLRELDSNDTKFLTLAKSFLGKDVKKENMNWMKRIQYPLELLFNGIQNINEEILKISTDEIKIVNSRT